MWCFLWCVASGCRLAFRRYFPSIVSSAVGERLLFVNDILGFLGNNVIWSWRGVCDDAYWRMVPSYFLSSWNALQYWPWQFTWGIEKVTVSVVRSRVFFVLWSICWVVNGYCCLLLVRLRSVTPERPRDFMIFVTLLSRSTRGSYVMQVSNQHTQCSSLLVVISSFGSAWNSNFSVWSIIMNRKFLVLGRLVHGEPLAQVNVRKSLL